MCINKYSYFTVSIYYGAIHPISQMITLSTSQLFSGFRGRQKMKKTLPTTFISHLNLLPTFKSDRV